MTELQGTHPRKPDWGRYLCDCCNATFWALRNRTPDYEWQKNKFHYCADCGEETKQSIHFTGGRGSPQDDHDRYYHGDQFTLGEW